MKKIGAALFASIILTTSAAQLNAQTANAPTDPFGRIFSARILGTGPARVRTAVETAPPPAVIATALFRYSDDVWSAGPALTLSSSIRTLPYRLTASYAYIRPDGGDDVNRAGATASLGVFDSGRFVGTIVGAYGRVFDRFSSAAAILAIDQALPRRFGITYNVGWGWIDIDDGPSIDDLQPGVGVSYAFAGDVWALAADYAFDNDVDGEPSWSVALDRAMSTSSKLNVGVEKHETVTLKFSKRF